ncbi:hypothetical protein LCGC14_1748910, partial [marine sediment metagenome]
LIIEKAVLKAKMAAIRVADAMGRVAGRAAALESTQDAAEYLLYAEARLGEMLAATPDFHSSGKGTMKRKALPPGIDKKQSHYAQTLSRNEDGKPKDDSWLDGI